MKYAYASKIFDAFIAPTCLVSQIEFWNFKPTSCRAVKFYHCTRTDSEGGSASVRAFSQQKHEVINTGEQNPR